MKGSGANHYPRAPALLGRGVEKKSEYFVMSDLYEDTSRILANEQIITLEGVVLYRWITPRSCQGYIKVISRSNSQKILRIPTFYHFLSISSCLVVQSSIKKDMMTHTWSRIISAHIFRKSWAVLINIGRGNAPMFFLITPPFFKAQLNKQNYNYAAGCSISLGFHRKTLIHNSV